MNPLQRIASCFLNVMKSKHMSFLVEERESPARDNDVLSEQNESYQTPPCKKELEELIQKVRLLSFMWDGFWRCR